MKTIFSSRRYHYLAIVSIFLVAVAFVTVMVGCTSQYSISISSTTGGIVTTPGEGLFKYNKGTVVNLVAEPDAGYRFVSWYGNVETIANVRAATTDITINNHYYIIASFER